MTEISDLFPYLNKRDIMLLQKIITYDTISKKEIIISPGHISYDFFYIYKGVVRGYFISESGEEITVFIDDDGFFVAAPESVFNLAPTKYYFETIVETKLFKFDFRQLEELANENKNILRFYLNGLKNIIRVLVNRLEGFVSNNPEQRFLSLYESRPLVIRTAHKKEIASFLGISPNSLSRIIARINNKI